MQKMDSQQAWGCTTPLSDQHRLVAQHSDDPEGSSPILTDWCNYERNYVGCSQIATNVPSQAVPLFNPQPHSNPEPQSGLIRHWYAGYAALSAVDTECQVPANDQSFQQNLLPWPQPKSTAELNSIPIPYSDTNYESFEQALTAGDNLATQRLGEPYSNPRQKSRRCVRCWALRKPVILFI